MAGGDRRNADSALLAVLAGGATVQVAAQRAHVSERTVYRRLSDPAFRQRVTETRAEMVSRAVGQLADAGAEAATTLRALLGAESESVRLGACRAILELGVKLRESEDLERRVAELEASAAATQEGAYGSGRSRWLA